MSVRREGVEAEDIAQAMVRNDELTTAGVLVSTKFNYPDFLGEAAWSTFGRLRPVRVNGVIWGAF